MAHHSDLFEEFSPVSKETWLKKVEKDLKGKPLEDLQWQLGEALTIEPFYHSDDKIGAVKVSRGLAANNDWSIGEDFLVDDPVAINKQLLEALENGINAPRFIFESIPSVEVFSQLFQGVMPGYIQNHFKISGMAAEYLSLAENFHRYLKTQDIDSSDLSGSFQITAAAPVIDTLHQLFPNFKCLAIEGLNLSGQASDVVHDLVAILQSADQTLQQIDANQVPHIQLSLSIGTSYFVEIAKLRALRILWANLLKAYDALQSPFMIDAYINPNAFDENANTNMIRSMTIAMAAVVGGVDRLTVLPSDQKSSPFSRRIARNVQHLLKMESYLDRVIDPAAGSFYIEKLTKLFAEKAWSQFKD